MSPSDASAWNVTVTDVFPGLTSTIRGREGSPAIAGSTTHAADGSGAPPVAPSSLPTPTLRSVAANAPSPWATTWTEDGPENVTGYGRADVGF